MFKMAFESAEAQGDGEVLILSALHGLLKPNDTVAPYDMKMGDKGSVTPQVLARQARKLGLDEDNVDVYSLLPKAYDKALDKALRTFHKYTIPVYEAAPGIGYHRQVCRIIRDTVKCMGSSEDVISALNKTIEILEESPKDYRQTVIALRGAVYDLMPHPARDPAQLARVAEDHKLIDFLANTAIELIDDGWERPVDRDGWEDMVGSILEHDDSPQGQALINRHEVIDASDRTLLDAFLRRLNQLKR